MFSLCLRSNEKLNENERLLNKSYIVRKPGTHTKNTHKNKNIKNKITAYKLTIQRHGKKSEQ